MTVSRRDSSSEKGREVLPRVRLTDRLSLVVILLTGTALVVRLVTMISIIPIDYRWESYHIWEIAYYTLKMGVPNGRMWDLEGLEYFWGPAPILTESFLLWVFNTTSIIPFRVLNAIIGTATTLLAFLTGKKYYNPNVGLLAAALIALNPITVFNSAIAMSETFGIFFLLAGVYFHLDKPFLSGVALAIASLSRAEFWLIAIGMIVAYIVFERSTTKAIPSTVGWLVIMVPYFIHVRSTTGNPFYSFYWNFLGNIAGVWSPWYVAPEVRIVFTALLVASVVGLALMVIFRRRVRTYVIPAVFLAFVAYHGLVYTAAGLAPLFERFFILDIVVGSLVAAYLASKTRGFKVIAVALIALQILSFYAAASYYVGSQSDITGLFKVADAIGSNYAGGTVLSDMPMITYRLIDYWHVSEKNIVGTIYMPKEDLTKGLRWIQTKNVTWLVVADPKGQSTLRLLEKATHTNPNLLELVYSFSGAQVYRINL